MQKLGQVIQFPCLRRRLAGGEGRRGEVLVCELGLAVHALGKRTQQLHHGEEELVVVLAGKERPPDAELHDHAAHAPHVDGTAKGEAQDHLGCAVVHRLQLKVVLVDHGIIRRDGVAEVNELDFGLHGWLVDHVRATELLAKEQVLVVLGDQQGVFGFYVGVNQFAALEEGEGGDELQR